MKPKYICSLDGPTRFHEHIMYDDNDYSPVKALAKCSDAAANNTIILDRDLWLWQIELARNKVDCLEGLSWEYSNVIVVSFHR